MSTDEQPSDAVDIELLEFDDDLASLNGTPYTGRVMSTYPDGCRESLGWYQDGLPHGLNEQWYPNGALFNRWIAIKGAGSSEAWTWYPDGTQRSYRRNGPDGMPVELRGWDENGVEIDAADVPPTNRADVLSALFARAMELKSEAGAEGNSVSFEEPGA